MDNIHRTEDEQVEALKRWWKDNGTAIILGLGIGLAAIVGYRYWQEYTLNQAQHASLAYETFQSKLIASDAPKVFELGQQIVKQYSGTPYSALAALGMARMSVETGGLDSAAVHLQWVISNSDEDGLKHTARIRLARVMAAQEKYDEALAVLDEVSPGGFKSLYQEVRGDILNAQNKTAEAREAYGKALALTQPMDERRALLEMKINELAEVSATQAEH